MFPHLWVANKHKSAYVEEASAAAERAQMTAELEGKNEAQVLKYAKLYLKRMLETLKRTFISSSFTEIMHGEKGLVKPEDI
ncbi:MAG: hypothetical protein GTO18_22430 [Anaerolineales bacterium]|nr:hypothetical protein [Anaerolineales bacterium]